MLTSTKPVVAVCAVRTGAGKSQTTRRVASVLRAAGLTVAAVRHPMPYGDLAAQRVQRFASLDDLARHHCTIEEIEEYEPHIVSGTVVYAGVDYEAILRQAEAEADVILWDGGNNDMPFYRPDLHIVVADPLRPGHELAYYPGETNVRMADVGRHQQGGQRDARGRRHGAQQRARAEPAGDHHRGGVAGRRRRRWSRSRASGCSSSRTARR